MQLLITCQKLSLYIQYMYMHALYNLKNHVKSALDCHMHVTCCHPDNILITIYAGGLTQNIHTAW